MRNDAAHISENTGNRGRSFAAAMLAALLALAGCGGGGGTEATDARTQLEETTAAPFGEERMLEVRRIDSGSSGQGEARPRAVAAPSIEALSAALGPNLDLRRAMQGAESTAPGGGEEVYVAVLWGRRNTGGYAVEVEDASLERERVAVGVALRSPPEGAIVTQALTYPYAIAAIENLDSANKEFILKDQSGRELDWPVEKAGF